jgi:hypothetical protein
MYKVSSVFETFIFVLFNLFKEEDSRSAGVVKRGKVVKKLDSRLTMYVDSFLLGSITKYM